ncbi:PREDICTED: DELLA protein RGL1-like [Ipomoea nil]|uniref:DELLA protein RGL1-like n=1 Tax=Ipomoea nil TaxID=35883 RepID=UPI000901CE29|nr:PREDICTED: DELLA protein RGL1-like [Ipomoea nil]
MTTVSFPSAPFNHDRHLHRKGSVNDELSSSKDDNNDWFEMEECDDDFDSLYAGAKRIEDPIEDQNQMPLASPNPQVPETPFSSASFEILKCYGRFFKDRSSRLTSKTDRLEVAGGKLSVAEILRLAGERCIQFFTQKADGFSAFFHPYASALSGISVDDIRDVELVHLLLAAGEEVSRRQFHLATGFISRCRWTASDSGTPVQRLAFQFAEALTERIERETGRFRGMSEERLARRRESMALTCTPATLASHQGLPFSQVIQFAGIQAIIERVKNARKIHLVDINIRSGIQWTILMQALAEQHGSSPIERIRLTAIGSAEREKMEECGKRLQSFADSLNLPFRFDTVFLSDLKDFREDLIQVEDEEVVAVLANIVLRTMIARPDCLDGLMRGIRRLRPAVMVMAEVEANHNSPSFINRFVEALFFYGAYFDCLEDCLDRDDPCRRTLEGLHFGEGIRNLVAAEGEERFTRSVKIEVWRAYFARFGMAEMQLSESSVYQANLVGKQFGNGNSCTLDSSGKGLIIGWKGTPIHSVTCWKFS